jgi:hypothetical protein
LQLDRFWAARLPDSREGTSWRHILQTLACYRLIDPGSEWRLHRLWFEQSAMGDLLGEDYSLVAKNALYRCLHKLLAHKQALFGHLRQRWQDLFGAKFDAVSWLILDSNIPGTTIKAAPRANVASIIIRFYRSCLEAAKGKIKAGHLILRKSPKRTRSRRSRRIGSRAQMPGNCHPTRVAVH